MTLDELIVRIRVAADGSSEELDGLMDELAGIGLDGRQIRRRTVWTPDPKMTPRQVEKELARGAKEQQ